MRVVFSHLPALLLAVAACVSLNISIDQQQQAGQRVSVSEQRQTLLAELLAAVVQTQNAHRGYLLSGEQQSLGDYRQGVRQAWASYGDLRHLSASEPQELQQLTEVMDAFQRWKSEHADPSLRTAAPSRAPQLASEATHEIDATRQRLTALREQTRTELTRERDVLGRTIARAHWLSAIAPAAILFSLLLAGAWLALRTARALHALRIAADRFADGDLDVRAAVEGGAEATSLAQAFNTMAEQLAERTRKTNLLADIAETLQACTNFEEACRVLAEIAPRLLPETSGRLAVYNASRNAVVPVAAWGDPCDSDEAFAPDDCWSLRKGRVHLFHPPRHAIGCHHIATDVSRNAQVCIPLTAQGDPLGVLHLEFGQLPLSQVNAAIELATTAAERFALALANLRLRDSLRDRSIRDSLTGLYNRRYLEETLDREFGRAQRGDQSLSMLVLDVDHFKRFNDHHGHEAGDTVLAQMGRLLKDFFRTSDIPCRFGGEEFVVVLPDAALVDAVHRAETLRELVANQKIEHRGTLLGPVSISVGVASFPSHGVAPQEVLRSADAALYSAKKAGRNRVIVATGEWSSASVAPSAVSSRLTAA